METNSQINEIRNNLIKCATSKDIGGIRKISTEYNLVDIAESLEEMDSKQILFIIRALKTETSAEVFASLDIDLQEEIINKFSGSEIKEITKELFSDDISELFDELPASLKNKIIKNTSKKQRDEINQILNYDPHTAGSLITTEYVWVYSHYTVKQSLDKIKELHDQNQNIETFQYLYITDVFRNLKGIIKLADLIFERKNKKISTIIKNQQVVSVLDTEDQEQAIEIMRKYDYTSLPVVNKEYKIIGIITFDDALEVVEEEATEDIHKMAAINPTETEYSKTSVASLFKSRVTWLLILMITATVTQIVIEKGIPAADIAILAGLIPLMMDTAGNAGGQSGAMIIRALSTNDISTRDYIKVLVKESTVALLIGLVIFFANWGRMIMMGKTHATAVMTSSAVFLTIIVAKILGGSLPIMAKKFKLDPAVVAAPLITTIVDLLAIIILFAVYSNFPFK